MIKKIKGVIFDYGCVISKSQDEKKLDLILGKFQVEKELFIKKYREFRDDYDADIVNAKEYWKNIIDFFNINIPDKEIDELIKLDNESWILLDEKMIEYIKFLKEKNVIISILSNMPMEILHYIEKNISWLLDLFDHSVFSCDYKITKPDHEIFKICLDKIKLNLEDIIFIDDTGVNIEAASKIGINTIHYTDFNDFYKKISKEFIIN